MDLAPGPHDALPKTRPPRKAGRKALRCKDVTAWDSSGLMSMGYGATSPRGGTKDREGRRRGNDRWEGASGPRLSAQAWYPTSTSMATERPARTASEPCLPTLSDSTACPRVNVKAAHLDMLYFSMEMRDSVEYSHACKSSLFF